MVKKRRLSPEDIELFRREVGEVKPVRHDKVDPPRRRPAPIPRQTLLEREQLRRDMLSDDVDTAEIETGDELLFARPGVQHQVLRKLRRGQFAVHAELDLHGLTVSGAREVLTAFLKHCQGKRTLCVRIIHGKGLSSPNRQPVLKGKLAHWLRQRDDVLAFCSARRADGGTGAVYVLLKHR